MTFTNTLLYDHIRSRDSHVGYIIFEKVEKSKKLLESKLGKKTMTDQKSEIGKFLGAKALF